jgi:hypothetical protein
MDSPAERGTGHVGTVASGVMSRHSHQHIEDALVDRFKDSDVTVDREDDGSLRIEIYTGGCGTTVAISGAEPSTVLAALIASPEP